MSYFVRVRSFLSHCKRRIKSRQLENVPFFRRFPAVGAELLRDSRTHINFDQKFVYSRLPKAGNSTVISTLYREYGDVTDRDFIETVKLGQRPPSRLAPAEIDRIVESFFVFTVVRNPFARLLSCYRDKIARPSIFRSMVSRRYLGEVDCEISLDQFLDFLSHEANLLMDAHWAPQARLLAFPMANYQLIGAVETLEDDLAKISGVLGLDGRTVSYVPHATGASNRLQALSDGQARKIATIYQCDFDLFGYSKDIGCAQDAPRCRIG